jgi:cytochrome P450
MNQPLKLEKVYPEHVPPELVFEYDYLEDPEFVDDPQRVLRRLLDYPPVFFTPLNGGHWIATRSSEILESLQKHEIYSSEPPMLRHIASDATKFAPIDVDPPRHTGLRKPFGPVFSPAAALALTGMIEGRIEALIDGVIDKGGCEFVTDIAQRLPTYVILELFGLPHDRLGQFLKWTSNFLHSSDPELMANTVKEVWAYLGEVIAERRANPSTDVISQFVTSQVNGQEPDDELMLQYATLLFFGGLSTVEATMCFMIRFLAENPEHRKQLAGDPELVPGAVEEMMRHNGIVNTVRQITQDTVLGGVQLKKGDQIMIPMILMGLDDRVEPDALTVDFKRRNKRHALFGAGPHRCAGSHLARHELVCFLRAWMRRIPDFSIAPGRKAKCYGGMSMGMLELPLVWPAQ